MKNKCHHTKQIFTSDLHLYLLGDLTNSGFFKTADGLSDNVGYSQKAEMASEYVSDVLCANESPLIKYDDENYYCLFHLPTFEKDCEQFKKHFDKRFALVMTDETFVTGFDFRWVWFPYELDFSGFTFNREVHFGSAVFKEDVFFNDCVFEGNADFSGAKFEKAFRSMNSKFKKFTDFRATKFVGNMSLENSVFEDESSFRKGFAQSKAVFPNCIFKYTVDFGDAEFNNTASFANTEFFTSTFDGAIFQDKTTFTEAIFHNEPISVQNLDKLRARSGKLTFSCDFKDKVDFETTVFDVSEIEANNTKFHFLEDVPKVFTEIEVRNTNFIRNENTKPDGSVEFLDIIPLFRKLEYPSPIDMLAAADRLLSLKNPRIDMMLNDWASEKITLKDDPHFRIHSAAEIYWGDGYVPTDNKDLRETASYILYKLQR